MLCDAVLIVVVVATVSIGSVLAYPLQWWWPPWVLPLCETDISMCGRAHRSGGGHREYR